MKKSFLVVACLAGVLVVSLLVLGHRSKSVPGRQLLGAVSTNSPGRSLAAATSRGSSNAASAASLSAHEFDLGVNPYAAALREPGKSKRAWNAGFLKNYPKAAAGDPIRFELTGGRMAVGTIRITQYRDGELAYLSGELSEPEAGKFFFLTPPAPGKAGKAVGVIEFPASKTAYRIEPTGTNGDPELWQRRLDEVICLGMPRAELAGADTSTNDVAEAPPLRPDMDPEYAPSYNSNIVSLQSYPGSSAVLLLDFFGGYTPTWGGIAYSKPAGVNNVTIRDLWKRVAEDYMGFNINVTTDIGVYLAAPATSRQRCCFTDTPVTAAGVAYIGSWNWGSDTPCWSVYTTGKNGAEVGAHEPGHTLGLGHQGNITGSTTNEYYTGQGSGVTGWAPIMGAAYYQPVTTWSKGEYQYANNGQDELKVIDTANNNVAYRTDDTGSTLATSRYLEVDANGNASAEGVIEQTGDTDAFQFTTSGGQVTLAANPVREWANLAVMATLADATDTIIASNNPQSVLSATITTNLPAGTYTFRVTGTGRNDPLTTGFTAYSSLGYYSVAGSVAAARLPTRLSVAEHSAIGTVVGTVPLVGSGVPLTYAIQSGNTGGTFAIDDNGVLTVANNAWLDYNRLATNTMLAVQFELFVNITYQSLTGPMVTELNRRVVVAVLRNGGNYPVAVSGFNAGIIVPCTATATTPRATGFDIPNNYCFYQAGLNANVQAGIANGTRGFPARGVLVSAVDGTTFQFGPYGGLNALMLGYTYPRTATLTLTTPQAFNTLAILAASANGGGNGTLVLNFTNGTQRSFAFNAQDWYGTTTNVAFQGYGRIKLGQGTLVTEDPGWNNPNLYQTTLNLAALGLNQAIGSITFTAPSGGTTMSTAVMGVSGAVMPVLPAIAQQPKNATNNVPTQTASFSVIAMGTPPLGYQWYYSANGFPGTYVPLSGQVGTSLVLGPNLQTTDAGSFYVVVTNASGSVTSTVAALTIYRDPVIVQQPSPASLSLMAGQNLTLSVGANAATPVTYYWLTNGTVRTVSGLAALSLANLQVANSANYSVIVSNAYGAVTSSTVALTVMPTNYPAAQLAISDKAKGYWRLDETTGTIAHDYVGGNNGIYNKVALAQPGYNLLDTHPSARFGSLAANTSLVTNIPVDFATSTNAMFSVEAWVNGSTQSSDAGLVTRGYGSGGEQFNLDCGGGSHAFRFLVRDIAGGAHVAASSVVPNGRWHHLVGVCDEVHSNVVLYVDGANAAQTSIIAGSGLLSSTNLMSIGCRRSGSTSGYDLQFVGLMEDVAVYNYALSAAQVQAHFAAATNRAPVFVANPFSKPDVTAGQVYSGSLSGAATDPNGDTVSYLKTSGPAWLSVAANGALSGTPLSADVGTNVFLVRASDASGTFDSATMNIAVTAAPAILASWTVQPGSLLLTWSGGIAPYQVEMTTNLAEPDWQLAAGPMTETSLTVQPTNPAAFYRISGQ